MPQHQHDDQPTRALHLLRSAGVSIIVATQPDALPEVLHWGRDLGELSPADLEQLDDALARQVSSSALDAPWPMSILPTEHDGWQGRPGLSGNIDGHPILPEWRMTRLDVDGTSLSIAATADGLTIDSDIRIDAAGVVRVRHAITNSSERPIELASLEATLPADESATEVLDFTGRWTRERSPQRRPLLQGSHVRESRRGRSGHDSPMLLALGTAGFGDRHGQLWAVHLAWSADSVYRYDNLPEGRGSLGAGELLRSGEISLQPGSTFAAPHAVFVWSDVGLDGVSDRLHASLRARPQHPNSARPVVLNTWEAVYFDHDIDKLTALADTGASIGVERFVLDDGWFLGRRDDRRGLGDWQVDPDVWPRGLHPLVDHVRSNGLEFGLWVEPEMVNLDSELARAHPDWLLEPNGRAVRSWRNQHVLDLANPEATAYLLESISTLVAEYSIDYLKWDQNRDLLEAVHAGRAGVDAHTRALYRLIDELRSRHPTLEIESCASGGARVDLGIIERTDRVWASDTNDPIERLAIQRWTELLLPPELIGAHVGPARAHTTARPTDLGFRMAVSLFGSAGIEWDITTCTPDELDALRTWIELYKRVRPLLHSGRVVHPEQTDAGANVTGVVSADRAHAVFRLARIATADRAIPPALRFAGLDSDATYRVTIPAGLQSAAGLDPAPPPWIERGELTLRGSVLESVGVRVPLLGPGQAVVLELERV